MAPRNIWSSGLMSLLRKFVQALAKFFKLNPSKSSGSTTSSQSTDNQLVSTTTFGGLPVCNVQGVVFQGDGFFYQDGKRVCEDCWKPVPRYVDFPQGLTSPESDGVGGRSGKWRKTSVEGKEAIEPIIKVVCLPCYNAAFTRVHTGVELAPLSDKVRE